MSHPHRKTLLAAAAAAALSLAGCASQGPQAPAGPGDALIGYWTVDGMGNGETVAQFCEDGTFRVFVREAGASERHTGRFEVQGDRIRFAGSEPAEAQFALRGDQLRYGPAAGTNPSWMVADSWRRLSR